MIPMFGPEETASTILLSLAIPSMATLQTKSSLPMSRAMKSSSD